MNKVQGEDEYEEEEDQGFNRCVCDKAISSRLYMLGNYYWVYRRDSLKLHIITSWESL